MNNESMAINFDAVCQPIDRSIIELRRAEAALIAIDPNHPARAHLAQAMRAVESLPATMQDARTEPADHRVERDQRDQAQERDRERDREDERRQELERQRMGPGGLLGRLRRML